MNTFSIFFIIVCVWLGASIGSVIWLLCAKFPEVPTPEIKGVDPRDFPDTVPN